MNKLHIGPLALAMMAFCAISFMLPASGEQSSTGLAGLAGYRLVRVDGAIGVAIMSTPQGRLVAIRPGESVGASSWQLKRLMSDRIEIVALGGAPSAGRQKVEDRAWMAVGEQGENVRSGIKPPDKPVSQARVVTSQPAAPSKTQNSQFAR
jgi:hypothetical protein